VLTNRYVCLGIVVLTLVLALPKAPMNLCLSVVSNDLHIIWVCLRVVVDVESVSFDVVYIP